MWPLPSVDSTDRRNTFIEHFSRCSVSQSFSRTLVELPCNGVQAADQAWGHGLLVRRSVKKPSERAYYVVFAQRQGMTLKTLAQVAGRRWAIEAGFEAAKQECGLDEYEARSWQAWHRHITLALLAYAFLVAMQLQAKKGGLSQG